jgi:hypothetical protein
MADMNASPLLTNPLRTAGRVLRAVLGFALLAGMLLLGLAVAFVLVVWALLRGRRPQVARPVWMGHMGGTGWAGRPQRESTDRHPAGEVVDAQVVREIPAPGR